MRPALTLRIHALLDHSCANGPGRRAVIWVQGCSLHCDGCCNPDAQGPQGGTDMPVGDILAWVRAIPHIEGVTLSGGEPLQQPEAAEALLRGIRQTTDLSVVLLTGYDWECVTSRPRLMAVARRADIVVAGPYRKRQHLRYALLGSTNQTIHLLTNRYTLANLEAVPHAEVVLDGQRAIVTGVNDATLT